MTTKPTKPTAAHAFGYDQLHPGQCCDCCNGYCAESDYSPEPMHPMVRFPHDGREWITDRYVSFDIAALADLPETMDGTRPLDGYTFATRATGPATGILGDKTLGALGRLSRLEVADSDVDTMHALVCDGEFVGFAMKGRDGLPVEYLARARVMAQRLGGVSEESLLLAARSIVAWLATEETP